MNVILEAGAEKESKRFENLKGTHKIGNEIKSSIKISYSKTARNKDKSDYSTVEKVIDQKTEQLLEKWKNQDFLKRVNGCISAGKEANVYQADTGEMMKKYGGNLAIKIYKVETMVFRDREDYIQGEHRFRKGHCRKNPRKLIKLWAEKEFRNLKRMFDKDLPVPEPLKIKNNVLLMEYIGEDTRAAPRLRDVKLNPEDLHDAYLQTVKLLRDMLIKCNLVHADYSEYNLLYLKGRVWVIDVSQSVEKDHPYSFEFLKRDIYNTNSYFMKKGVLTFKIQSLFDFITDVEIKEEKEEEFIQKMKDEVMKSGVDTEKEMKDFLLYRIPTSLGIFSTFEEIQFKLEDLKTNLDTMIFGRFIGRDERKFLEEDDDEEGEEEERVWLEEKPKKKSSRWDPFEGMTKQERKKLVKQQNKEKRKNKLPKKKKKQMMKKAKKRKENHR